MKFFSGLLLAILVLLPVCTRSEMQAGQYLIYADSIDSGGEFSTGGLYRLYDVYGENAVSQTSNGTYIVRGGFLAMTSSSLSISISSSSLSLGTLDVAQVKSASTTITVTSTAEEGYTLSIGSVTGTSIAAVADGTVTAGSEEYGFSVSGMDAALSGDNPVTPSLVLAASSTAVTAVNTIVTFKASISPVSAVGIYTQNIVFSAAANL